MDQPEHDPRRVVSNRPPRNRSERLPGPPDASDPAASSRDWRKRRLGPSDSGRITERIPAAYEDLPGWLQQGGWRYLVLGAAVVIFAFVALLLLTARSPGQEASLEATSPALSQQTLGTAPLVGAPVNSTSNAAAPSPAAPTAAPAASNGETLVVSGTGNLGLFLRAQADPNALIITTLAEGTQVTVIGDDVVTADRVWKHIRDQSGQEGYAAADFLQPAP